MFNDYGESVLDDCRQTFGYQDVDNYFAGACTLPPMPEYYSIRHDPSMREFSLEPSMRGSALTPMREYSQEMASGALAPMPPSIPTHDLRELLIGVISECDRRSADRQAADNLRADARYAASELRAAERADAAERRADARADADLRRTFEFVRAQMGGAGVEIRSRLTGIERKLDEPVAPLSAALAPSVADKMATPGGRRLVLFILEHGMNTENGTVCMIPRENAVIICTTVLAKYCRAADFYGEEATKKWVVSTLKQLGATFATSDTTRAARVNQLSELHTIFGLTAAGKGTTTNHTARMEGFLQMSQSHFFELVAAARNADGSLTRANIPDYTGVNFGASPFFAWGVHQARINMPIAGKPWWSEIVETCYNDMSAFASRVRFAYGERLDGPLSAEPSLFGPRGTLSLLPIIRFGDVVLVPAASSAGANKRRRLNAD